jgi:hypothetical protein
MCVDYVLALSGIAQVDPGDEPHPEVVLSQEETPKTPGATLSAATPPTLSLTAPRGRSMTTPIRMTTATCHTRFLCQNQVLIACLTQDQLFHTYDQKCSQITK